MSKEFVKERVLKYLMEDLYVPQDMIETNVSLSEFDESAEGIIDIVVNVVDDDGYYVPVLVVICLDEDFVMEGEALNKQMDYLEYVDSITTAGKMILTNGNEMMYLNCEEQEYDEEDPLPTYDEMVEDLKRLEKSIQEAEMLHAHDCDCGCHEHEHHHDHDCDCGCHDHE